MQASQIHRWACLAVAVSALGCGTYTIADPTNADDVQFGASSQESSNSSHDVLQYSVDQVSEVLNSKSPSSDQQANFNEEAATSTGGKTVSQQADNTPAGVASVEPAKQSELTGIWKWCGNMKTGRVNGGQYNHNRMTFYPGGRYTRYSEWNPDFHEGQTRVTQAEGLWRQVDDVIEVVYSGAAIQDTTRVIDQFPYVDQFVPGQLQHQTTHKAYRFKLQNAQLQREDGNLFRRISSDPSADPNGVVDHEAKRWKKIAEQIYSSEFGY